MTSRLAESVLSGDRRSLAQAITLVESTRSDHRAEASELIDDLLPQTGGAVRVAITGSPGAGKSSLIEVLGLEVVASGQQVAVLAIDPSSDRSGGSILGDKTRMDRLAREDAAFIRPSPSGGTRGGIARRTREVLLLCEAAGFDVVLVETVGVGQSETAASRVVDCMVLVAAPGGGDELQGIKRGIMELADVVVVNKSDGELRRAAERTAQDLRTALHLMPLKHKAWTVPVVMTSAVTATGLEELWDAVRAHRVHLERSGVLAEERGRQAVGWMWQEVHEAVLRTFDGQPSVSDEVAELESQVRHGQLSAGTAARRLMELGHVSRTAR